VQVLAARRMHLSAHLDDVATGVYRCIWHLLFTPDSDFPPVTYSVETSPAGCAAPHVRRVLSARALDTIKTGHWTMVVLEDLLFVAKPCTVAPRRANSPARAPRAGEPVVRSVGGAAHAPGGTQVRSVLSVEDGGWASGLTVDSFALVPVLSEELAASARLQRPELLSQAPGPPARAPPPHPRLFCVLPIAGR